MTLLKICGLRRPDQAQAVAELGVDAIGVIAVPGSPRYLEPPLRPALFAAVRRVRPGCRRVLVVADPGDADLAALEPQQGHDVIQLHGQETPEQCLALRRRFGLPLWKALRLRDPRLLESCDAWRGVVDGLLLDAWLPGQLGGTGQPIPPEWLADFAPPLPWWLAGGISPERVPALLAKLRPTGLDASSGVEEAPGVKNLARVAELLAAVRSGSEAT